jgi:hypothetical protein
MEKETKFNITKKMELLLCYKRTRLRKTAQQMKLQKCGRRVNSGVVGLWEWPLMEWLLTHSMLFGR